MIVPVETRNWSNNKVHVCVLFGVAGPRMEYAVATIHFKIANKIFSEIVNQFSTMTRRMEKNGTLMLRLPVKEIVLIKSNAVVSMEIGKNGHHVTSLVFTKINNQYEPDNVIAMTLSQIQVKYTFWKFIIISYLAF